MPLHFLIDKSRLYLLIKGCWRITIPKFGNLYMPSTAMNIDNLLTCGIAIMVMFALITNICWHNRLNLNIYDYHIGLATVLLNSTSCTGGILSQTIKAELWLHFEVLSSILSPSLYIKHIRYFFYPCSRIYSSFQVTVLLSYHFLINESSSPLNFALPRINVDRNRLVKSFQTMHIEELS